MAEISKIIRKQQSKLVDTLARKSHFKQDEVEGLLALYRKLSEGAEVDRLDRTRFRHCEIKKYRVTHQNGKNLLLTIPAADGPLL